MTELNAPSLDSSPSEESKGIIFAGGHGYPASRNQIAGQYIADKLSIESVRPLPDIITRGADSSYTIATRGIFKTVKRSEAIREASHPSTELSFSNFQKARAHEMISSIEAQGFNSVDAIFQSADALNGLLAVHERSDLFRNVVLAYPAGIIKQPSPLKATGSVFKSIFRGRRVKHQRTTEELFEIPPSKRSLRAPSMQKGSGGFVTAAAAALSYQAPLLHELRQQSNAPNVSLVVGIDDWMIRPARIIESLAHPDDIDFMLVTDTPHGIKGRKDVIDEIVSLFPLMEQRQHDGTAQSMTSFADRIIFSQGISDEARADIITAAQKHLF